METQQAEKVNFNSVLSEVSSAETPTELAPLEKTDVMSGQVDAIVSRITGLDSDHSPEAQEMAESIKSFGLTAQKQSGKRSQMLRQSIGKLDPTGEDKESGSGQVGNLLMDLNTQMTDLDPSGVSLDKPWWANLQTILPFLKTPIQKYFLRYQSADSVIDNIRSGLVAGQNQLKNDSIILKDDQVKMRKTAMTLEEAIKAGMYLKTELDYAVENEIKDEKMQNFVKDQILFPLNQRVSDLQQQLAVNQQGIMTSAIIIRTNEDLIGGVDRALTVTMTAMEIAVSLSLALANQKLVLKQLNAVNKTTGDMIANVGAMLKTNAADIQKQASEATLDMEQLKQAMQDTRDAVESVRDYRINAIDHMTKDINELNVVLEKNQETISEMDEGERVRDSFELLKN